MCPVFSTTVPTSFLMRGWIWLSSGGSRLPHSPAASMAAKSVASMAQAVASMAAEGIVDASIYQQTEYPFGEEHDAQCEYPISLASSPRRLAAVIAVASFVVLMDAD